METTTYTRIALPADRLHEILITREERRRRKEAGRRWRFWPDYPDAFLDHERAALMAAPDPIAIVLYSLVFENKDEWKHPGDLLDARQVNARFRAAGLRFANWRERHARTEAALAYLMDAGLVVPGIDCRPFKLGARWWMARLWRRRGMTPAETEHAIEMWREQQIGALLAPHRWAYQIDEPSPAVRRDYDAAAPMVWRLLRRLPAYAHLPEEHPPRGETYAQAQRRIWGRHPAA